MKVRIRPNYNKKELVAMGELVDRQVQDALAKVQWMMIVALNDVLGIGEERILRVLSRYPELLREYNGYKRDDVADEMLERRVRQILPNCFQRLYEGEGK